MAKTLLDLQRDMMRVLGESGDTTIGAVDKGDGTGDLITNAQTFTDFLNDTLDEIARTAYLLIRSGTKTIAVGDRNILLSAFTVAAGARAMRRVWTASYTPTAGVRYPLDLPGWEYLELRVPGYETSANGTPAYLYEPHGDALNTVALEPPPTIGGTLTVTGPSLPTRLVSTTDAVFLSDDWARAAVVGAAAKVCYKGLDDPLNQARYQLLVDEYNDYRVQIRSEQDPRLAKLYLDPLPIPNVRRATKQRNADAPAIGDGEA